MTGTWTFDEHIANDFDEIARTNIPHYEDVIQKSVAIATSAYPDKKARVIDVGSALGRTMECFIEAGFSDVHGVDNAPAMLARSRVQENLILSDTFPIGHGPFHVIVANWTLHFISDAARRAAYIRDMHRGLHENGVLVLTEKTASSPLVHEQYLNFKRAQGVPEHVIREKTAAIEGVLVSLPLSWYLETLHETGFTHVEVADAAWCFNTFVCRR